MKELDFWATLWGIKGNICDLSDIFNTKKPFGRVSSKKISFKLVKSVSESPLWGGLRGNVCDLSLADW